MNIYSESRKTAILRAGLALTTIVVITFLLLFFSLLTQNSAREILTDPVGWMNSLDSSTAFDVVSMSAELLAAVLAIAITVIAIIVELAANRYSHRITSLFVREPINIAVMGFFVIATMYSVWVTVTLDAGQAAARSGNPGLIVTVLLVSLSLTILLPYFAFVMSFLSPVNIIGRIRKSAQKACTNLDDAKIEHFQHRFLNAVDELQDISRRAVELSDRAVEMASINALAELATDYQQQVDRLTREHPDWFRITDTIIHDPDFISIDETTLANIEKERLWVETKILRQYLDLISDNETSSRDTSYLIAIRTKEIALASLRWRPELELVQLCIRCFNSYMRAAINHRDPRTGYYLFNQYRMLAESLLEVGESATVEEIALHLRFYGILGFKMELPFLLEVAAEDITHIAAEGYGKAPDLVAQLLDIILELDQEIREEYQAESLLGVRRAQIKLATFFLHVNDQTLAGRIVDDLRDENRERVSGLVTQLEQEHRSEYWEFTDRGVNFGFLKPKLRSYLPEILAMLRLKQS